MHTHFMHRHLTAVLGMVAFACAIFLAAPSARALDVPEVKAQVNDYANMISPKTEQQINAMLTQLEASDSTQVVVVTVPSLQGDSLEDFSLRVAEAAGIGQKGKDNGALLLVSKGDRKMRIEVGYGLEGRLTDVLSGQIIDNVLTPAFKAGRFDEGFLMATTAMAKAVRGEYKGSGLKRERSGGAGSIFKLVFLALFVPIWMFGSLGRRGGRRSSGILPLLIAGSMMSGSSRSSGGFGGGGFGGFSGGGGGFGGGGASGGW